ncbi:hypothetical protein EV702DRAFT_979567 [Suillus placidus]|uniref:Dienelactone hydrolase domain-containing protein n=1 Tax=Suillus placidus TaxID=48579 RepID=A0A9P6ZJR5_9AGAM|nr:hypothetical protein EV702DRAFT_979567 [Suillus placidus]
MSSILAGPLTDHCFTSVAHSGTAKGKSITIAGVPTYLSAPQAFAASGVETVILYFSDVFGPFYINAQLVQDYYASQAGFTVVGIDYFFGDPVHLHLDKPGFDRSTWRTKSVEQARASVPKWVDGVKEMFGTILFMDQGFCFGAPYVFQVAVTNMLSCAAVAHPTSLTEELLRASKGRSRNILFNNSIDQAMQSVPLLFSCAGIDTSSSPLKRTSLMQSHRNGVYASLEVG